MKRNALIFGFAFIALTLGLPSQVKAGGIAINLDCTFEKNKAECQRLCDVLMGFDLEHDTLNDKSTVQAMIRAREHYCNMRPLPTKVPPKPTATPTALPTPTPEPTPAPTPTPMPPANPIASFFVSLQTFFLNFFVGLGIKK